MSSVTLDGSPSTTILNNITYDPFGPITGWTWGNGTASTSRTFDTDGKLTQITSSGQRTFGYDDAFRITSVNDIATPANSWTLGYDLLDRLNSATKTGTTIGYTYDANGNRLTQTGTSASTYTVSSTSNRLSSTTGALARTYSYNNSGSVLASGATTHTYYNSGRMKTASLGAASDTTYVYNALGQRVKKSGGAISTAVYFVYDEAGRLVGEYNISGSTVTAVQETVWLGDIPVATLRGTSVFYVHTDQLNSPRRVTDTSNQARWAWDPSPFGEGAPNENPASLGAFQYNLRFPGQYFDLESNLNYNYFRDLDPATGRYVESDPLGLRGGTNTFAYVGGSPAGSTDSFGLFGLTTVESWRRAPTDRPDAVGETNAYVQDVHCKCEGSGKCWKLSGCLAALDIEVRITPGLSWPPAKRVAEGFEQEHVNDFREGIAYLQQLGEWREEEQKSRTFGSQEDCELQTAAAVARTLNMGVATLIKNTIEKRDLPDGGHKLRWYHYIGSPF